jgi:nucleoside-diphosphate-sugar epimerase
VITGDKPTVVVTGISGSLGLRTLRLLDFAQVIGVDIVPAQTDLPLRLEKIDMGREPACRQLVNIFKQTKATAVVHLAFLDTPVRSDADAQRMWQVNVAGTARVMEAITEINRQGGNIRSFVFLGSALAYGPETHGHVKEDYPLGAQSLLSAIHKQEGDDVVRFRAHTLGACATYVLRPAVFAGAGVHNVIVDALHGVPNGGSKKAQRMREQGKQLPFLCPTRTSLESRFQFVHADDVARLIAYILRMPAEKRNHLSVLNVAARGTPVTLEQAAHIAGTRVVHVHARWMMNLRLHLLYRAGLSNLSTNAMPYLLGSCLLDTTRLKSFLGNDYERVIRYTMLDALEDCFGETQALNAAAASVGR